MEKTLIDLLEPMAQPFTSAVSGLASAGVDMDSGQFIAPALYSAAISLKRIADALDGTSLGVDVSDSLAGLTRAFDRAQRS